MTRFVLDTDTVSLLQHGNPRVAEQVGKHPPDEVATTIITVEEQLSGWYTLLRRARTAKKLVPVYDQMSETVRFLARLPILTFTEAAAGEYERLRQEKASKGPNGPSNRRHRHLAPCDARDTERKRLRGH